MGAEQQQPVIERVNKSCAVLSFKQGFVLDGPTTVQAFAQKHGVAVDEELSSLFLTVQERYSDGLGSGSAIADDEASSPADKRARLAEPLPLPDAEVVEASSTASAGAALASSPLATAMPSASDASAVAAPATAVPGQLDHFGLLEVQPDASVQLSSTFAVGVDQNGFPERVYTHAPSGTHLSPVRYEPVAAWLDGHFSKEEQVEKKHNLLCATSSVRTRLLCFLQLLRLRLSSSQTCP